MHIQNNLTIGVCWTKVGTLTLLMLKTLGYTDREGVAIRGERGKGEKRTTDNQADKWQAIELNVCRISGVNCAMNEGKENSVTREVGKTDTCASNQRW